MRQMRSMASTRRPSRPSSDGGRIGRADRDTEPPALLRTCGSVAVCAFDPRPRALAAPVSCDRVVCSLLDLSRVYGIANEGRCTSRMAWGASRVDGATHCGHWRDADRRWDRSKVRRGSSGVVCSLCSRPTRPTRLVTGDSTTRQRGERCKTIDTCLVQSRPTPLGGISRDQTSRERKTSNNPKQDVE